MKEIQTTNPCKKTLKKRAKYQHISDGRNGLNEAKECCSFSATQGPLEKAIYCELVAMLQENVVSCSSVARFCREAILGVNSEEASSSPKDDYFNEVNEAILLALSGELFSSVRQTARRKCVPKSALYRRLVDSLHFTLRHLHLVFHKISDSQKATRLELSIQLRDFLLSIWHPQANFRRTSKDARANSSARNS
jgi:hypothetical protein